MPMKTLRPAIAMIELIFAIVIMGIVMMSAPMLISTATKSTYVALKQEGINEAASRVNMIMGYAWAESNTDESHAATILQTSGHDDLKESNISGTPTGRRAGTPIESPRTFLDSDGSRWNATAITDDGDMDDIDDFIGDINLTLMPETTDDNDIDYVEKTTVKINTAINYNKDSVESGDYNQSIISFVPFDNNTSNTTNIKSITVILTSTDTANADVLEKTIKLRAFSCNIGGYELKERAF